VSSVIYYPGMSLDVKTLVAKTFAQVNFGTEFYNTKQKWQRSEHDGQWRHFKLKLDVMYVW